MYVLNIGLLVWIGKLRLYTGPGASRRAGDGIHVPHGKVVWVR